MSDHHKRVRSTQLATGLLVLVGIGAAFNDSGPLNILLGSSIVVVGIFTIVNGVKRRDNGAH